MDKTAEQSTGAEGWVIGEFDDALVVGPRDEVSRLAILNDALRDASTWGELLDRIGCEQGLVDEVSQRFGEELPGGEESFDVYDIHGYGEGGWPPSPFELMMRWLPPAVTDLGAVSRTLLGDDLLRIDPGSRSKVELLLAQLGVRFSEDDSMVSRACGAWRYG